jgi:proton-translocating NADH-quinone oxidoreductase chain L
VCSYLLIGFWHTRILANKAALKAMIINRIADVFFIIAILLILIIFKAVDYLFIFNLINFFKNDNFYIFYWSFNIMTLISFFLFIGCVGKSAQIGLHMWLPDAMEGPTPVSALLHAATMVTAGVFLLLRCNIFFEFAEDILIVIALVGALTSLFSAIISVFQYDIKKVIAYSTCSQLGYMVFSCGLSNYEIAIFHLFNHAFFKALLFLGAGAIIHSLLDEQDMRKMGNLVFSLPLTYVSMLIGSMAIIGFPFLSGFYSKDLVLELAYSRYVIDAHFIYTLGISTAFLTAVYSIRLLIFVFFLKR